MDRPRRIGVLALALLGMVVGACGGGGTDNRDLSQRSVGGATATQVQFLGDDKVKLAGVFTMPDGVKGSVPGVLLVPGTARTDRDGVTDLRRPDTLYRDLSKSFTDAGMATFRYDRRGVGLSKLETAQQRLSYDDLVGDARAALDFLSQRKETEKAPLAVVGYDTGGLVALSVAAADPKVKSVVLVSTPGRPVADVYADSFSKSHGQASADAFRREVDTLLTTGLLPARDQIRPEHEAVLPDRQDALLKTLFTMDPLADASRVNVPTLILTGQKSTLANATDAQRLSGVLRSAQTAVVDTKASFQVEGPDIPPPIFNPADESTHTFGAAPYSAVDRDANAVSKLVAFLAGSLNAKKQ